MRYIERKRRVREDFNVFGDVENLLQGFQYIGWGEGSIFRNEVSFSLKNYEILTLDKKTRTLNLHKKYIGMTIPVESIVSINGNSDLCYLRIDVKGSRDLVVTFERG